MAKTIEDILKALERLGVRKGSSLFREEADSQPPRAASRAPKRHTAPAAPKRPEERASGPMRPGGTTARGVMPAAAGRETEPARPQTEEMRMILRARDLSRGPFAWGGDLFERQARFLENLQPRQAAYAPCPFLPSSFDSPYNLLYMDQLLYYFYWRAAFRAGHALPCDGGYAQLFLRECAAGVGCESWQRTELWARLLRSYPDLPANAREKTAALLVDQYAISADPVPFWDRMAAEGLSPRDFGPFYEYSQRLTPGSFSYALSKSCYDPREGKYLKPEDLPRLERAWDAACQAAFDLMDRKKVRSSIVLWGRLHKEKDWKPLYIAYARYVRPKIARTGEAVISETEKFTCRDGECVRSRANLWNAHQSVFIGYLLKRCEARMRVYDKYRYHLNPSPVTLRKDLFQAGLRYKQLAEILDSGEFDLVVDDAIDSTLRPPAPKLQPVRVDSAQLDRIRRDADIVRAELTVEAPEEAPAKAAVVSPSETNPPETDVPEADAQETVVPEADAPEANLPETDVPGTASPEEVFLRSLSASQRQALAALLAGEEPAIDRGVMPEVFWEGVNELALDALGDTVYDGDAGRIYEEYADALKARLESMGG